MPAVDVLIKGAKVIDGSGNPWFYGDVAISGEIIMAVTPPDTIAAQHALEVIEAQGMVVCPGFIDIQSHSIVPLMMDGRSLSKITQGVTTEIMGEAWTPAPFNENVENPIGLSEYSKRLPEWSLRASTWERFSDWLEDMVEHGVSVNVGSFLGGGTLRQLVMGLERREATEDELKAMRRIMAECMDDGAFGVSYALIYPPDAFTNTHELIEVCKVVSEHKGIYITHLRSEANEIFTALDEAFRIGREAKLPVEIYHLKASGKRNWDKMPNVLELINEQRAQGLDVTADMYPYAASGTGLTSVLPTWIAEDGRLFDNLADPVAREKIKAEVLEPKGDWEAMASEDGPSIVMPIGLHKEHNKQYIGKRLDEIAHMRGQNWVDTAMDLILNEGQRISTIYFSMSEDNVRLQVKEPWIKFSTDAGGFDPEWARELGPTHPRAYGTYTKVLGQFVREEKLLAIEDAIRKMTSAVADRIGLRDRGLLRAGMKADVVVFDPAMVIDQASFENPHRLSVGISDVWVNGKRVLEKGQHTGAKPGQFVKP
ncbi:MAG: D-aminoacylase [Trueperaceae bacterium]|nr:D-aminoacylase [Trueperaceae bacterium]